MLEWGPAGSEMLRTHLTKVNEGEVVEGSWRSRAVTVAAQSRCARHASRKRDGLGKSQASSRDSILGKVGRLPLQMYLLGEACKSLLACARTVLEHEKGFRTQAKLETGGLQYAGWTISKAIKYCARLLFDGGTANGCRRMWPQHLKGVLKSAMLSWLAGQKPDEKVWPCAGHARSVALTRTHPDM